MPLAYTENIHKCYTENYQNLEQELKSEAALTSLPVHTKSSSGVSFWS